MFGKGVLSLLGLFLFVLPASVSADTVGQMPGRSRSPRRCPNCQRPIYSTQDGARRQGWQNHASPDHYQQNYDNVGRVESPSSPAVGLDWNHLPQFTKASRRSLAPVESLRASPVESPPAIAPPSPGRSWFSLPQISNIAQALQMPNPSFQIEIDLQNGAHTGTCQATLVRRQLGEGGWVCAIATASHCLREAWGNRILFATKELGIIEGTAIRHPYSYAENQGRRLASDVSLILFQKGCEQASHYPIVPLRKTPIGPNEPIVWASRRYHRLLPGFIADANRNRGFAWVKVSETLFRRGLGFNEGDSGGGMFTVNADGNLELAGVLSHMESEDNLRLRQSGRSRIEGPGGSYTAVYPTNSALHWLSTALYRTLGPDPI